ncbi:MAG: hypothetical protein LBS68_00890 [Puniceicoccales bacterium]|nr:hypothetical protein [Puniceicoccales bacterium]
MIIILFVIGVCNCPDDPEVSGENEIPPPADDPPDPQPNEQVVDAPPRRNTLLPTYVGVNAILSALGEGTRNQVDRLSFENYGEGVDFKTEIRIGERLYILIFASIQDVDTVFPKIRFLTFHNGGAQNSLTLDDCLNQKFRELECIDFFGDCIAENFSLTILGTFNSLKSITFAGCKMETLAFSRENLNADTSFNICDCPHLVDVTGIWDGGNLLLDRSSFFLHIDNVPLLNIADLNAWLNSNVTKYVIGSIEQFVYFVCQNNGRIFTVKTNQGNLEPGDLNALTHMDIWTKRGVSFVVNIPSRKNTQHPWNINVRDLPAIDLPAIALEFEDSENVADAGAIFQQNATATGEINTEDISNFQLDITRRNPSGKIKFNNAPREPVAFALTKKNPLFTVEFANLDAVPEELLLREIPFIEGAADAVPPRAPNAANEVIAHPVVEPHGLEIVIGGNSKAVNLWRKDGVDHYLAVGESRDVSGLEHAGWREVRKEEINGFEGGILFRRENVLPAPVP